MGRVPVGRLDDFSDGVRVPHHPVLTGGFPDRQGGILTGQGERHRLLVEQPGGVGHSCGRQHIGGVR